MERKYELLKDETIDFYGKTLYRIRATESFCYVTEGEKGGFVESYNNLTGDAWVTRDAKVLGNAVVSGDAKVYGNAKVCGNAMVFGNARVAYGAKICGNATIGNAADILTVFPLGYYNDSATFFKCADSKIRVTTNDFHGTIDEFAYTVAQEYGDSEYAQEYKLAIQLAKLKIKVEEESK